MSDSDVIDDTAGDDEPVAVAVFASTGEAEVAQAKLRAAGVASVVHDQVEGGTVPVDGEVGVRLVVAASDADAAIAALGDG